MPLPIEKLNLKQSLKIILPSLLIPLVILLGLSSLSLLEEKTEKELEFAMGQLMTFIGLALLFRMFRFFIRDYNYTEKFPQTLLKILGSLLLISIATYFLFTTWEKSNIMAWMIIFNILYITAVIAERYKPTKWSDRSYTEEI